MDTAVGLFPVGPEEKEAGATKRQPASFPVFSKMLRDTRPTYHLSLRATQDQDESALPPAWCPAVLQPSRVTSNFAFCLVGQSSTKDSTEIV